TVQCARCHDHKFDPIPQVEYYRMMAVLKPVFNPEAWIQPQHRHLDDAPAKAKEAIDRPLAEVERQIAAGRRPHEKKLFEARLAKLPEAIRADTAAALATPAAKRNAVQKYLAEKLGPSLRVPPEEVSRSLSSADRARAAALEKQLAALKARR